MPVGLYRRKGVANASKTLHQLSMDKQFSDQTIARLIVKAGHWFMQKESSG